MQGNKPHLLIIRLSAMGDVAMTAPVLGALRAANPDLKITILTRGMFKPFFRDIAGADVFAPDFDSRNRFEGIEIIAPDFQGRHKGFVGLIRLWRDIMSLHVTHVADLHDVLRTKVLRRFFAMSGCRMSVVDKGRTEKRLLTRKYQKVMKQLEPMLERYRKTIEKLGFTVPVPKFPDRREIPVPEEILTITGSKNGTWIGVAPFAKHRGKIYPTAQTDHLIDVLSKKYEHVFIFGGGQYEKDFAEAMEQRHNGVISVIGKIRINGELDLISNIDVMVTMDSAAMHMSSLVGVPVVSVWGATHPYAGFYGFGQDPDNAVQLDMPCRPCSVYGNKPCMFGDYRCMARITPEMIAVTVENVLSRVTYA